MQSWGCRMFGRKKLWNCSLHNVSKKRLAEIMSGHWKPKPAKPLRTASKKSASLWTQARKECLKRYDHKCFLCGRSDLPLHAHHYLYTRQQRPDLKYDQSNLCCLCAKCHNHCGADEKFYELKAKIHNKIQRTEYNKASDEQ